MSNERSCKPYFPILRFTVIDIIGGIYEMEYELAAKHILHGLQINCRYRGYYYIVHAMGLMEKDEFCIDCITKNLYVDIAKKYGTSRFCVERNIRTVIEGIWCNDKIDRRLVMSIFGVNYRLHRPSNKEFLEYLFDYVELYLYYDRHNKCPVTGKACILYPKCRMGMTPCLWK